MSSGPVNEVMPFTAAGDLGRVLALQNKGGHVDGGDAGRAAGNRDLWFVRLTLGKGIHSGAKNELCTLKPVVPKRFGTGNWIHGRQFFYRQGG